MLVRRAARSEAWRARRLGEMTHVVDAAVWETVHSETATDIAPAIRATRQSVGARGCWPFIGRSQGESTRREIAYAESLGKPVRYLSRERSARMGDGP